MHKLLSRLNGKLRKNSPASRRIVNRSWQIHRFIEFSLTNDNPLFPQSTSFLSRVLYFSTLKFVSCRSL